MTMKKMLKFPCIALAMLLLVSSLLMTGCSESVEDKESGLTSYEEYEITSNLTDYIENNIPSDLTFLLADDWLFAYITSDDKISVTIETYGTMEYLVPYVAKDVVPVVKEAVEQSGLPLDSLRIQTYINTDAPDSVRQTVTTWKTEDFETGLFVSENNVRSSVTIDELLEEYADYADIVQSIRNGE